MIELINNKDLFLTFEQGPLAKKRSSFTFLVCPDPYCLCQILHATLIFLHSDGKETSEKYHLDFDLENKSIKSPANAEFASTQLLIDALKKELTNEDYNILSSAFTVYKTHSTEDISLEELLEKDVPKEIKEKYKDILGQMVTYKEFFSMVKN